MADGKVEIDLEINDDDVDKKLDESEKNIDKFAKSVSNKNVKVDADTSKLEKELDSAEKDIETFAKNANNKADIKGDATLDTKKFEKGTDEVIDNAQTAVEKAKELWIDKFGTINGQPYNPINGRKIEVSYDSEEECWHIYGTLPPNTLGGVPHVIIRKDGKVIAIWHDD